MYKILIKIAVVAAGLILISAHTGAALTSKTPISYMLWNTGTALANTSASLPGCITLHNLPSLMINAHDNTQPNADGVAISISSGYGQKASPALGELDGIAWDKLEQPAYIAVITRLVALPAANELWAPVSYYTNTSSFVRNTSNLNYLVLSASTAAISHPTRYDGQADQLYSSQATIIDCAICHMPKRTQISLHLPGVE